MREARDRAATCASSSARARRSSRRSRDSASSSSTRSTTRPTSRATTRATTRRRVAAKRARLEGAVFVVGLRDAAPGELARGCRAPRCRRASAAACRASRSSTCGGTALYPLSRPLRTGLIRLADEGGRAILLLNRRGEAPALHCRSCGRGLPLRPLRRQPRAARRPRACAATTAATRERAPSECPACGSVELARLGAGTERVSEAVTRAPARTSRCCASTPTRPSARGSARRDARALRARARAPCSSARRWWPRATTSAICAWLRRSTPTRACAWPDFRSEERTFALLTQLAGRSGRRGDPGSVVFQAWDPDQRVVRLAAEHAVEPFLTGELARRELLGYPPFRHLVRVEVAAGQPGARDGGARRRCARPPSPRSRATSCSGPRRSSACAAASARSCSSRRCGRRAPAAVLAELVARQGRALRRADAQRRGRRRPSVDYALRWRPPNTITSRTTTITTTITTHDHGTITAGGAQQEGDRARGARARARDGRARARSGSTPSRCCASPRARSRSSPTICARSSSA